MYKYDYGINKGVGPEGRKRGHQGLLKFGGCFASRRSAEAAMDFGEEIINIENTIMKFFKDTTKKIKDIGW